MSSLLFPLVKIYVAAVAIGVDTDIEGPMVSSGDGSGLEAETVVDRTGAEL